MEAVPQSPLPVKRPEQVSKPGVILQFPGQAHTQMVNNVATNLGTRPAEITPITPQTPVPASKELYSVGATIVGSEESGLTGNDVSHHVDIVKHAVTGDDNLLKRVMRGIFPSNQLNRRRKQKEEQKLAA